MLPARANGRPSRHLAAGGDGAYLLAAAGLSPAPVRAEGGPLQPLTAAMICGGAFRPARARAAPNAAGVRGPRAAATAG